MIFLLSLHQLENNELKMPKFYDKVNVLRKPEWLKIRLQSNEESAEVERIVKEHSLHTICSSGLCPNKAECWRRRTATFMILGEVCTRGCKFCATQTGKPLAPDHSEPEKVAEIGRNAREMAVLDANERIYQIICRVVRGKA